MSEAETLEEKLGRLMWQMENRHQARVRQLEAVMRDRDGSNQLIRDQLMRYMNKERQERSRMNEEGSDHGETSYHREPTPSKTMLLSYIPYNCCV